MAIKYIKILSWMTVLSASSAYADVMLKDESDILGKWKLYAEASKLDGEKKMVDIVWDFAPGGVLNTSANDTRGRTQEMKIAVGYRVEDGVIKKELAPGRGKYESCTVVEKTDADMTIKCTFQYFFLTKK
ncbi:MAG: hypothetical protein ACU841_06515 [Gammaproteobacteria bacterium]